jgi:hypothetical protein
LLQLIDNDVRVYVHYVSIEWTMPWLIVLEKNTS